MDSADRQRRQRRARLRYELSRLRRASIGFAPVWLLVGFAAAVGARPGSVWVLGTMLFTSGVLLLWYGRALHKAVLPGVAAGMIPLLLALGANSWGHICTGSGCTSVCVPACVCGGLLAGLLVAAVGRRGKHGAGFWCAASAVALFTGAMGCACIGYSGVVGLVLGFLLGLLPTIARIRPTPAS